MGKQYDILAIDDEQVILDSVRKLCTAEGWLVDTALDAVTGLDRIKRNPYRLIVCDIMLPGMDGFQFLEELAKKKISTPVIITTGFSTLENAIRSLDSGAIDFLAKPFTVEELISAVHRGLNYGKILTGIKQASAQSETAEIIVPCPPKYYRLGHFSWLSLTEDGSVKIGVTDLFLKTVETVAAVNLLDSEEEVVQGNPCAFLETENELYHNILSPISGRIVRCNTALVEQKDLVLKDPYFAGWFYTIIPSDLEYELKHLVFCSADIV